MRGSWVLLWSLVLGVSVQWHGGDGVAQTVSVADKTMEFEVVSIREDKADPIGQGARQFGPTRDGYRMKNFPLIFAIRTAYIPAQSGDDVLFSMNQIAGMPDWIKFTGYDIEAKVSEGDMADWQNPALQPEMMRAMLRTMMTERFKLSVHRGMKEASVFEMTVAKGGAKFKTAEAGTLDEIRQKHPGASASLSGTISVAGPEPGEFTMFHVTMPGFAALMSNMAGRPILDKTGMAGRYDVTYRVAAAEAGASGPPDQVQQTLEIMGQLGLKLQPAKGMVETLVIDHVEKPSEN